jgi:hypothetical protein
MKTQNNLCKIKPEFDGDETLFLILEDNGDRLIIQPAEWHYGRIAPQELIAEYMIERIYNS